MADKNQIAAVLEHLLNNEQQKAEELFHEYVVGKSREIYENLIDSEIEEEVKDEDLEETNEDDLDEANEDDLDESNEDDLDEDFEEITAEGDDEVDDLIGDIKPKTSGDGEEGEEGEEAGEEGEEEDDDQPATKGDLKDIVDELEAAFAKYAGGESDAGELGGDDTPPGMMGMMKDDLGDLETVREYVEKVPAGHGAEKKGSAEKADNTKSIVASENNMGGTTANIAKGGEGGGKESGLTNNKPQDMKTGNVNVVGGTNAKSFYSKNGKGHGAEKKGTAETGVDATSIIRGSR